MPTTTTDEREVVRYFENYVKTTIQGKWVTNFVDTKLLETEGGWTVDGFFPSA